MASDGEVARLQEQIDDLKAREKELRNAVWELQRQARTRGFQRGMTPVERDK